MTDNLILVALEGETWDEPAIPKPDSTLTLVIIGALILWLMA